MHACLCTLRKQLCSSTLPVCGLYGSGTVADGLRSAPLPPPARLPSRALERIPQSVRLWKAVVEISEEDDARVLLVRLLVFCWGVLLLGGDEWRSTHAAAFGAPHQLQCGALLWSVSLHAVLLCAA